MIFGGNVECNDNEGGILVAAINVKCTVNNCYFWAKDNMCSADSILITSDSATNDHPSMTFGQEEEGNLVQSIGNTPAHSITDTACHTFKSR
jgi:hypothetical protein